MNSNASRNCVQVLLHRALLLPASCGAVVLLSLPGHAQEARPTAGDCTAIDLRYTQSNAPLTDAEISALRDARQQQSLNQFERCAAAASGQQGNGAGSGGGSGNASAAGSGVAGTESPISVPVEAPEQPPVEVAQNSEQPIEPTPGQGRAPIDIPPADSDGVLAAQIRRAAEAETNPQRRNKLWNEYRKIKGLVTR